MWITTGWTTAWNWCGGRVRQHLVRHGRKRDFDADPMLHDFDTTYRVRYGVVQ